MVADQEHLHLELALNPFELSFFREVDTNRNQRLEPTELAPHEEDLVRRLSTGLVVLVDGTEHAPESAGIAAELDSHHLAYRAHYKVDARTARVVLRSNLDSLTSGAHVTEVTYLRPGGRLAARLDVQSRGAVFPGLERSPLTDADSAVPQVAGVPVWLGTTLLGVGQSRRSRWDWLTVCPNEA